MGCSIRQEVDTFHNLTGERGLKGEKEVEERLKRGFEGFTFKTNRTKDGCGYDFLARCRNQEVEIEVKSLDAKSGQMFLTQKEFERAQENPSSYHLWTCGYF
jgi:hypothetical protein